MGRNFQDSARSGNTQGSRFSFSAISLFRFCAFSLHTLRFPLSLALLPFLLFLPLTLVRETWYVHDIQHYFYTYHTASANILRSGSLPLWNPYAFAGIPLLGDGQTAMFYPSNWLFFLFPGAAALNYAILFQFSIAGVGMYGCARSWGLGCWAASIAALAFMFGGMMTARVVHLSILSGVALVPWLVWCVDRALRAGSDLRHQGLRLGRQEEGETRRQGEGETRSSHPSAFIHHPSFWFVAAAVVAALQVFAGHPQVPVYTAVGLALLTGLRAVEACIVGRRWWPLITAPLRLAGIYVLGYALAAIQLVPWVELGLQSPRAAGATFEFVMGTGSFGTDWLLWLFPYVYGAQQVGWFADAPMPIGAAVRTWEHSAYVGVSTLALALVGLGSFASTTVGLFEPRIRRAVAERPMYIHRWWTLLFLVVILALSLVTAAGKRTPFADLVYAAPVVGKLRDVERVLVLAAFALAMLAGFGLQWLIESRARRWFIAAVAITAGGVVLATAAFWVWFAHQKAGGPLLFVEPAQLKLLELTRANAAVPLALAFGTLLLLLCFAFRPPGPITVGMITALVLADIVVYTTTFNPTTNATIYAYRPQVLDALEGAGQPFRKATVLLNNNNLPLPAAQEALAVSWGMAYGVEDVNGFNSLQPRRYTDYVFGSDQKDVSYAFLPNQQLLQPESPILSSLNVRYVLVPKAGPQPVLGRHLVERYSNTSVRVYENTLVWPRAFFPQQVRTETDPQTVLQTVTAPGFDARRETLVESTGLPDIGTSGSTFVQITQQTPNQIELRTRTDSQRLLVMSEMYFPGWSAYIDGHEVPIERANYLFRAVVVPAGEHTVSFSYRPNSALLGALISALAVVCALVIMVWSKRSQIR